MEARSLTRALRARPAPFLLTSRQQPRTLQSILPSTLRYNSSDSSSQTPPPQETTEASKSSPSTTTERPTQANTNDSITTDFDEILNKLDLGNRTQSTAESSRGNLSRRIFSDSVSRSVTGGVGSQTWREQQTTQLANRKTELKLGPTLGRQVLVEPERGVDLAAAIRNLQITVNSNKIKRQAFEQKFHVRKGAVRKQLRRTRWRKLFHFSFHETVKKIQRMQAQGW